MLFSLLEDRQGTLPRSRLERLATLPLTERPLLLVCLSTPDSHIRVLWGMHYMIPSFTCATPEDGAVLVFPRNDRLRILPTTVEVQEDWLSVQDVVTPTATELDAALAVTGPFAPRLPEVNAASDTVAVAKITLAPLTMVHPLQRSPLLTPLNAWNLIAMRAVSLGLEHRVTPLLCWLRSQTSAHTKAVNALPSIDLSNSTFQARQELRDKIIPPPPPLP